MAKPKFDTSRQEIRRTIRIDRPWGCSVQEYIERLQHEAEVKGVDLSKIYLDFDYEMGYYNNPDLYVELVWMSPETDKEYNKRITAEKERVLKDAENARKSRDQERALYEKLKLKYGT